MKHVFACGMCAHYLLYYLTYMYMLYVHVLFVAHIWCAYFCVFVYYMNTLLYDYGNSCWHICFVLCDVMLCLVYSLCVLYCTSDNIIWHMLCEFIDVSYGMHICFVSCRLCVF